MIHEIRPSYGLKLVQLEVFIKWKALYGYMALWTRNTFSTLSLSLCPLYVAMHLRTLYVPVKVHTHVKCSVTGQDLTSDDLPDLVATGAPVSYSRMTPVVEGPPPPPVIVLYSRLPLGSLYYIVQRPPSAAILVEVRELLNSWIIQKEQGAHRKRKGTLNLQTFFQLQNKNNPTQGGMFMSPKEEKCATYVQMLWTFHHIFSQSRVHNPGLLPQSIMSTWNLWYKLHPFLPARAKRQVWWTL